MASSSRDVAGHQNPIDEDDPMLGAVEEEEEEDQPVDALSHDSSEEEDEDEEEERRIREGFIVDEDEDEEAEAEDVSDRKRRRKRRKRRHRRGTSCHTWVAVYSSNNLATNQMKKWRTWRRMISPFSKRTPGQTFPIV